MDILGREEFEQAVAESAILRTDSFGPKVYAADPSRIVKLFRRKRLFTLRGDSARRFCRNAELLRGRGFNTVVVERCGYQPDIDRQVVVYSRLQGVSLREALQRQWHPDLLAKLARYLARLHAAGIYFRSLHFDNILVDDHGEFALIDVLDMRVRPFLGLGNRARLRNFRHLVRYRQDLAFIERFGIEHFWAIYAENSGLRPSLRQRLERQLRRRLKGW